MKHSFLVWLTLGLAVIYTLFSTCWVAYATYHALGSTHVPHGTGGAIFIHFLMTVYYGFVVYGVLKRPSWGYGICVSFVLLLFVSTCYVAFVVPGAMYGLAPQIGGTFRFVSFLLMAVTAFYAYMVTFGSRPFRHYFSPPPESEDDFIHAPVEPGAPAAQPQRTASHAAPAAASMAAPTPAPASAPEPRAAESNEIRLSFD